MGEGDTNRRQHVFIYVASYGCWKETTETQRYGRGESV